MDAGAVVAHPLAGYNVTQITCLSRSGGEAEAEEGAVVVRKGPLRP